ncbi:MAG: response regulator transcription factor [Endomicrobiia bacterium]
MHNSKTKIAIVCNNYDLVGILKIFLEKESFLVKITNTEYNIFEEIKNFNPNIILLDLDFSNVSGWELLKIIKNNNNSKSPVIAMSGKYTQPIHIVRAINDFYADDYLVKPFPNEVLLAKIKSLLRRNTFILNEPKNEMLRCGALKLDIEKMEVSINGEKVNITPTELKILYELMKQKGKPLTRNYLRENIMGYFDYGIEIRTIDKHIASIRKKLKNYGKRIITVTGIGYKFC